MYCSECGVQIDSLLNFCNRCGNRVAKGEADSVAKNLSNAVAYVGGFGFVGFVILASVMLRRDIQMDVFAMVSIAYLAAVVSVCWLLIRYSSQLSLPRAEIVRTENMAGPEYLSPRTTAQLEAVKEPPASVVDNTTRSLDEVRVKR